MSEPYSDAVGNYFIQCPFCQEWIPKNLKEHGCQSPGVPLVLNAPDDIEEVE